MTTYEKNWKKGLKRRISKITEKMPPSEALKFIDRYKDMVKQKHRIERQKHIKSIGEILNERKEKVRNNR